MSALTPLSGLWGPARARAEWAVDVAAHFGVPVTVTSVRRSWAEQSALRRRWEEAGRPASCQTVNGQYVCPANRPGESAHEWGLAWDSTTEPRYQSWWDYLRRYAGFEVLPNDDVHAQVPNWRSLVGLQGR